MNTESFDKNCPVPPKGEESQAGEKKVYDPEVAWRVLVGAVLEHVADLAKGKLPPLGIFAKFGFGLRFPGEREIHGHLFVEPGSVKNERVVRVGVYRNGSDRMVNNYFFFDSTQAVLEWLKAEETVPVLVETYRHLRERVE